MAALENKAVDSKREMDILDGLQELKTRNARIERAGKQDPDKFLERVSSGVEVGDSELRGKLTEFETKRSKEAEEDEEEVRRVFGRAYVSGVPDIELEDGGNGTSSSSDDGSEPFTPNDNDEEGPIAGSSKLPPPTPVAASIKRKLEDVEPTPASLLSAASRSIVEKSFGVGAMGPPAKKKGKGNSALAAKLGIKLKK